MIVQIYEVSSATEARAVADLGVDHIGVLVGPGRFPRELGPEAARSVLAADLPRRSVRVALTLAPRVEEVVEVALQVQPDVLHIGTTLDRIGPRDIARIRAAISGIRIMRSVPVVDATSVSRALEYDGLVEYLLLDTHRANDEQIGATGLTHDWSLSRRIVESVAAQVILAGGLGPHNVAEAIRRVQPAGVDSKTCTDRLEGSGKDLERVQRFVEAARARAQPRE